MVNSIVLRRNGVVGCVRILGRRTDLNDPGLLLAINRFSDRSAAATRAFEVRIAGRCTGCSAHSSRDSEKR